MAITHIVFGNAGDLSKGGMVPALINDGNMISQTMAPTGSNQVTTIDAPAIGHNPVCVISTDTAVFVAIGEAPDATVTTSRHFVPAGVIWGVVCDDGDKAAVVTAT